MNVLSPYAPHTGYDFSDRQNFFHALAEFVISQSTHGPKLICGDFNARLFRQLPGEEDVIGPYVYENQGA